MRALYGYRLYLDLLAHFCFVDYHSTTPGSKSHFLAAHISNRLCNHQLYVEN